MLDYELDAFGKRLGLPALALNENGLAVIAMDGIGTLTLQKGEGGAEDMLLVALASPVDPTESAARYRAALELAHRPASTPERRAFSRHADPHRPPSRSRRHGCRP